MLSVEEARTRVLSAFSPLQAEQISLIDSLGRVLAEDVRSRRTQPPVAVSAMMATPSAMKTWPRRRQP